MGHYGVTPLYGLSFLLWSFTAWIYAGLTGIVIIPSLGGILAGLAIGVFSVRFRLRQLETKGEIKLSAQAVGIAVAAVILFIYLAPILASLPLESLFTLGKIGFGASAGFWGPTWFFFRRWEKKHHKEIVSGGFWSTKIYTVDPIH